VGIQNLFVQIEEKLIQWFGYAETVIVSDECVTLCMGGPHNCTVHHNIWTVVVCHRVSVSSSIFGRVSVCMVLYFMVYRSIILCIICCMLLRCF